MKVAKDMMLMTMGGMAVLAYQKYKKPMMKKIDNLMHNAMED